MADQNMSSFSSKSEATLPKQSVLLEFGIPQTPPQAAASPASVPTSIRHFSQSPLAIHSVTSSPLTMTPPRSRDILDRPMVRRLLFSTNNEAASQVPYTSNQRTVQGGDDRAFVGLFIPNLSKPIIRVVSDASGREEKTNTERTQILLDIEKKAKLFREGISLAMNLTADMDVEMAPVREDPMMLTNIPDDVEEAKGEAHKFVPPPVAQPLPGIQQRAGINESFSSTRSGTEPSAFWDDNLRSLSTGMAGAPYIDDTRQLPVGLTSPSFSSVSSISIDGHASFNFNSRSSSSCTFSSQLAKSSPPAPSPK